MSNIRLDNSNYIYYVLKSEFRNSITLTQEPVGWSDDFNEIERDKKWHGIFEEITSNLEFRGVAADYINTAFSTGGHNTELYIAKFILRESSSYKTLEAETAPLVESDFELDYLGFADWDEKGEAEGALTIRFRTDALKELIIAQESNVFELERFDDIRSEAIPPLVIEEIYIEGRSLEVHSESQLPLELFDTLVYDGYYNSVIPTEMITEGDLRHTNTVQFPDNEISPGGGGVWYNADLMFYVNDTAAVPDIDLVVNVDAWVKIVKTGGAIEDVQLAILKVQYNYNTGDYMLISEHILTDLVDGEYTTYEGSMDFTVSYKQGLVLIVKQEIYPQPGQSGEINNVLVYAKKCNIKVIGVEQFDPTPKMKFMFINNIADRLLEIMTGEKGLFYSKFFGRAESTLQEYTVTEDGEYGFVGVTSGYWVRVFESTSDRYKSLQINMKDLYESLLAVFNIGRSIDTINGKKVLRFEDLKYYYQNSTIVTLPNQVSNVKRKTDKTLFYGSVNVGYKKGGDYENQIGLDEPNTNSSYVTPLYKAKNTYSALSKIRGDEYGMEILRRKPATHFPDEDMSGDEDNWFLDVMATPPSTGYNYRQKVWEDVLQEEPSGVLQPSSFRAFIFTPLKMFQRHGWIVRAGLEQQLNQNKFFKWTSSIANSFLRMLFISVPPVVEVETVENQDILTSDFDRPRFVPELITFTHPVDEALLKWLKGYTEVEINGEIEKIPNWYFKIGFTNEKGEKEAGYLLKLKPVNEGEWEFIKANENTIF